MKPNRLNTLGVSMAMLGNASLAPMPTPTTPFFNPTRSQRIKNKLNRKRYGK